MAVKCHPHELSEAPRRRARLHYQTEHAIGDVLSPGYFDPAAPSLRAGDIIELWAGSGDRAVFDELVVVREAGQPGEASHMVEVRPLADFRAPHDTGPGKETPSSRHRRRR